MAVREGSSLKTPKKTKVAAKLKAIKSPKASSHHNHPGDGLVHSGSKITNLKSVLSSKLSLTSLTDGAGKKKIALLAVSGISIVILGLFFSANLLYKNKILPNTSIGNLSLSSNPEAAKSELDSRLQEYKVKLNFQDQDSSYSPEELGISTNSEETINSAKLKNSEVGFFKKPFSIFSKKEVPLSLSLDQAKLEEFLKSKNYSEQIPADAKIEFNSDSDSFAIIPEVSGRGISVTALSSELQSSTSKMDDSAIKLNIQDIQPEIKAQDLESANAKANQLIAQKIVVKTPVKSYYPSASELKDWLSLTPNPQNKTYDIGFNASAIEAYLNSIIKKISRDPENRTVAKINGQEFVIRQGSVGYKEQNNTNVPANLQDIFKGATGGELSLNFVEQPPQTEDVAASGGRWIFADLSEYKLYAYEGSNLVNSFPMSSGKSSTPTPTGSYNVTNKVRVKTMTSGGDPNDPDYYSVPNIEWVAYFKSGGYAMHGVYWHNLFGIQNTSHGCMGMSNSNARWVWDFVSVGTPVIIVP